MKPDESGNAEHEAVVVAGEHRAEEASAGEDEQDFTLINDQECHETVVDYSDSQVWRPKKR